MSARILECSTALDTVDWPEGMRSLFQTSLLHTFEPVRKRFFAKLGIKIRLVRCDALEVTTLILKLPSTGAKLWLSSEYRSDLIKRLEGPRPIGLFGAKVPFVDRLAVKIPNRAHPIDRLVGGSSPNHSSDFQKTFNVNQKQ